MNADCQEILDRPDTPWEPTEQDKKDLHFLQYVRTLRNSKDHEKEEAAHQIALVKQRIVERYFLENEPDLKKLIARVTETKIFLSLLMRAILNQAIAKGKEYVRSRKQKIDSIFEQTLLVDHLLIGQDLTQKDFDQLGPFKKVLELPQTDAPYDQVGALEMMADSIEDLIAYGQRRVKMFREAGGNEETAKKMEAATQKIIEKAAQSPWMLKTTPSPGVNELGMEVDILNEVNQEVRQEVDQEIDQELLKELEIYEQAPRYNLRNEDPWDDLKMGEFLSAIAGDTPSVPKDVLTLPELWGCQRLQCGRIRCRGEAMADGSAHSESATDIWDAGDQRSSGRSEIKS